MLIQLADFSIKTVCFFWLGLFLIRFYCLLIKFNLGLMGGNLGHFIFRLTDWILWRITPQLHATIWLCCFIAIDVFRNKSCWTKIFLFTVSNICSSSLVSGGYKSGHARKWWWDIGVWKYLRKSFSSRWIYSNCCSLNY